MSEEDDFDLNELDDKELVEQIQDDLYDGLDAEVTEGTEILLSRGWDANDVLGEALVAGMKIVGVDFRDGILFVPEVLKCAGAMKGGMGILRPILAESAEDTSLGKFVIGTVKGDIHDIGKNIVGILLQANGYEVIDLGRDVPVSDVVDAAIKHEVDFIAGSALMTTTMPSQREIIKELKDRGIQDKFKCVFGGAPTSKEWAEQIGADGWAENAAEAVDVIKELT